jgi:hypothetical protein
MNAQLKEVVAILDEAIAMLPHERSLALRVRLAQVIANKPKTRKRKLYESCKPIDNILRHVFGGGDPTNTTCLCAGCTIMRGYLLRAFHYDVQQKKAA